MELNIVQFSFICFSLLFLGFSVGFKIGSQKLRKWKKYCTNLSIQYREKLIKSYKKIRKLEDEIYGVPKKKKKV